MASPVSGTDYSSLKKQILQIAPETVAGTAETTGFKKLHAMILDAAAEFETEIETAKGARFPTSQVLKKDMAKAAISGKPDFNEIDFLLASVLRKPTITGTGPYTRVYDLLNTAPSDETRQTFTIQYGSSVQCETYAGGLLNDFQLTFDREAGISQSGNMNLGALDLETALVTSDVTEIAKSAMLSKNVDIVVADTHAGLATAGNKLVLPWVYTWGINGRADEYWALNSEYAGPAMYEEGESQGYAGSLKVPTIYGLPQFLDQIREGKLIYTRVTVTGKKLTTDPAPEVYEKLQIDQCWFVQAIPTDNYKAVYSKNINLVGAQSDETGWLKSCEVTLINSIAGA
jgi:hypothetical protein